MGFLRAMVVSLLVAPLRLYKQLVSPLLPPSCRYHPSCSVYAMGALRVHGPLKGVWLALRRVARCHPFGGSGLDPIPPRDGKPAEALVRGDAFLAQKLAEPPPPWFGKSLEETS